VGFLDAASAVAPLAAQARVIAHGWLDQIEELILNIIIRRALRRVSPSGRNRARHRRAVSLNFRTLVGSALRRALRAKELRQRIDALSQDIEVLIARLIKRLAHGLTRLRPIVPRRERGSLSCLVTPAHATALADTS